MNIATKRILAAVFSLGLGVGAARAATYTIATGETFELASDGAANAADNLIDVSGSATLKLTGTATDGMFPIRLNVRFLSDTANAVLTVDATEVAGCTTLRMTGHLRDNSGTATIALPSTIGELVMGSSAKGSASDLSFPALEPDVSFAGTGRVVFTNDATVARLPACAWTAAEGARLATMGTEVFGPGDFALMTFDVELCDRTSFTEGATVSVPAGRTLYVRPCKFSNEENGTWVGTAGNITNDIALGGAGAAISYQNNNAIDGFFGTMKGTGDIFFRGNGNVTLHGALDYDGTLTVGKLGVTRGCTYTLCPTNGATVRPVLTVAHSYGADLAVRPDGWQSGPTAARLTSIVQTDASAAGVPVLHVAADQTLTVGSVSGSLKAVADGEGAALVVENLAADAKLYLQSGVALTVQAFEEGAEMFLREDDAGGRAWSISGPASGAAVRLPLTYLPDMSGASLTAGGRLAFDETLPFDRLTVLAGAEVTAPLQDGTRVRNEGGALVQVSRSWRDKVTLWTDASETSTFTSAREDFPGHASVIGASCISEWRDRRPDRQGDGAYRFRLTAFDGNEAAITATSQGGFPITNVTDGLRAVRCTRNRGRMQVATGKGAAASLSVKYALFVFNSYDGGGNAFFCTPDGVLKRVSDGTATAVVGQKPLIYADDSNAFSFRTNGVDVASPTETYTTGGWQIISFANENGVTINNIGHAQTANTANGNGGQRYAEILLFGELPTEEERAAAETYLAEKWGLAVGHAPVHSDGTVNLALDGSGTVALDGDAAATNGWFTGTVALNGHRLELSSEALPLTEATIPAADRVLWMDPSLPDAVELSADEAKADEVANIYTRDNAGPLTEAPGRYLTSPYVAGGLDRRVRMETGSRGDGPAMPWLVFRQKYEGDMDGNHLLFRELPVAPMAASTDTAVELDVKAGFFALDTTDGAGTVIAQRVNGSGDFAVRSNVKTDPIFKSTCSADVRAADAWLDEKQIDPSTETYTWRPEVFAFNMQAAADPAKAKLLGFYGQRNLEVVGEVILYSATQTETVRRGISAYLMKKWLGRMHEGFSDFRGMTVTGAGTLAAEGPEFLPTLTAEFTGTVELTRTSWSFTLPKGGGDAATDAVALAGRTVALPPAVTVALDVTGAEPGVYRLMAVGAFAGNTVFTPGAMTGLGGRKVQFAADATGLYVRLLPKGISISFR